MYKLVLFLFATVVIMLLQSLQLDQEIAIHSLFQAKRAVNRAAHAAAQQLDLEQLAVGVRWIQPDKAEEIARFYLQENLKLDAHFEPLAESANRIVVDWLVFDIVNADESFPYHYENETYEFDITMHEPGVILMIHYEFIPTFQVMSSVSWVVKGVAELTW